MEGIMSSIEALTKAISMAEREQVNFEAGDEPVTAYFTDDIPKLRSSGRFGSHPRCSRR
jgi:hypothetical protein